MPLPPPLLLPLAPLSAGVDELVEEQAATHPVAVETARSPIKGSRFDMDTLRGYALEGCGSLPEVSEQITRILE
ncbi:MAG: hypothetical protein WBY94_04770 [Polyangiaceae bacterium]